MGSAGGRRFGKRKREKFNRLSPVLTGGGGRFLSEEKRDIFITGATMGTKHQNVLLAIVDFHYRFHYKKATQRDLPIASLEELRGAPV